VTPPVTRVFDSYQAAREAIRALEAAGIDAGAISVVTRSPREAETLEYDTGASEDLEDVSVHRGRLAQFVDWLGRIESVAVPGFGAVLGTGDLWQDVQLAGSGRGSVTGALVGCGVPVDEADRLEQAVFSGRILLVIHGKFDAARVSRVLPR
jgi:hypothetical protein